jgi:Mce-associated membrane protein
MARDVDPPASGRDIPWLRTATAVLAVLAVASVLVTSWYGVAWYRAVNDPEQTNATMRDEALRDARQIIVNLEAVSYDTLDADLDRWESSITGPLLDDFRNSRSRYADQIRKAQSKAEPKVVDAAVTELNPTAGTAKVLVFVDLTVIEHKDGKESGRATRRQRIKMELTRTDQGWKASAADPVGAR